MSSRKSFTVEPPQDALDWAASGMPGEAEPEAALPRFDRNEHRAQMLDLKALANRLAKLPQGLRRTLPLDEELQGELDRLAAAAQLPHRRRLVMRVKLLLGAVDLVRLNAVLDGDTDAAALERVLQHWRTRILAGDDAVLQAFIDSFPAADRQALRTAAREARREGPVAARASSRLHKLLRDAASAPPESSG
ncbi:MAG: DUF615 domain-containing protein [Pseudomonadota bacterium]|nr:DUF615 domain-containing protein [Pseudomonadota bacterium]